MYRTVKYFLTVALFALAVGCSSGPWFTIQKGTHSSGTHFSITTGEEIHGMAYKVTFLSNCVYSIPGENMYDWNKLYGRSYGFSHQQWSIRWGWRAQKHGPGLEITPYLHVDGEIVVPAVDWFRGKEWVHSGPIPVMPGTVYMLTFEYQGGDWINFRVICAETGEYFAAHIVDKRFEGFGTGWGYKLWPWFGGDETAQDDCRIYLRPVDVTEWNLEFDKLN